MTGSTHDKQELELVDRYIEEHFNPIRRLLGQKIPDPDVRELALRRCTRHIFHWKREVLGDEVGPDHPDDGEPVKPGPNGDGDEDAGFQPASEIHGAEKGEDEVAAEERPPEHWATGDEPATPRQLAVLKDRGVPTPEDVTKARASQLITKHVYGDAEA